MIEIGRIKSAIKQITDLPTLPEIYQQVAELVERPDVSARQLEEVISLDPALSSKILRMVNSAFYGLSTEIASIERAVAVLGFDTLKQLVLTSSVLQVFKGIDADVLDPKAVWKHSLATAMGARAIGRFLRCEKSEVWFTAGLLHDIGILFFLKYLPQDFADVISRVTQSGISLEDAEDRVLGQTHAETGAQLLRHWKLPVQLVTVVAYHHEPQRSQAYLRDIAAVQVAELLARAYGWGSDGDERVAQLSMESWKALGLKTAALPQIADEIEAGMDSLGSIIEGGAAAAA